MKTYPFYDAASHLNTFYGIYLEDDDFETIGMFAWEKIGNKYGAYYLFEGETKDCKLKLPCNVGVIESVTTNEVDSLREYNKDRYNFDNHYQETLIEQQKRPESKLYVAGKLIEYTHQGDYLIFRKDWHNVKVLYLGVTVDDDGLPLLTNREVEAVSAYCAYVDTNKRGMVSRDRGTIELAQMLKMEWDRLAKHARVPEYMNQNEMDTILNAQSSWNRKKYNISFKPISK